LHYHRAVRIALVSPYSWTYPGGVTQHIEALAAEALAAGHDVSVLAPWDPDDRLAAVSHRGARPVDRSRPEWLVPLGRTVGLPFNGAVSNVALSRGALVRLRHELAGDRFDVVHVHEPIVPTLGWDAVRCGRAAMVATFHCYSENRVTNNAGNLLGARWWLNRLHARIAVSEAAAWTGRRFFGGRYRVIPNGVALPAGGVPELRPIDPSAPLRMVFVGQAVQRKGLGVLLRAFEALRDHVPVELTLVGCARADVEHLLHDPRGVHALGKVNDAAKHRALVEADVLCAPSLGGESFGMVLTEAFAAGTPVVASDIAGYREVVRPDREGVLVAAGDATALAEALRALYRDPARRLALAQGAGARAQRFTWPHVAGEVLDAYADAREVAARSRAAAAGPAPAQRLRRAGIATGALPADGRPRVPARRLPSLEPARPREAPARRPVLTLVRRLAIVAAGVAGLGLGALAVQRIGLDQVARSLLDSSPPLVLCSLALMCAAMSLRAVSWHAILRAALPAARVRRRDALQGTFIGVLMSATLPARLGEPSRAFVVARRLGRVRERFPVVLGTLVSQTLLNLLALAVLGAAMFSTVGLFAGHEAALAAVALTPLAALALVLLAPLLLRGQRAGRAGAPARRAMARARGAVHQVRSGLSVFADPRLGPVAAGAQLGAWVLQWAACWVLLDALGLSARAGAAAAAAVLFAVNVTAVLPVTPSNLGVFQAACVAVLAGAYGISAAQALGYGIVLQAVEVACAVVMGTPALLKEGLSWREVRLRALHTAPVRLEPEPGSDGRVRIGA